MNLSYEDFERLQKLDCESQPGPLNESLLMCPAIFDGLLCWNFTHAGQTVKQHCPVFDGFNSSAFAFKKCLASGEWMSNSKILNTTYTDYMKCIIHSDKTVHIYFTFYSLSIFALAISMSVLFYLKQLRCDRITLHKNLFFCHLINSIFWNIYLYIIGNNDDHPTCPFFNIIVNYTGTATYFWMLSEGIYLVLLLVFTFTKGRAILRFCVALGWGFPLILTAIFAVFRYYKSWDNRCYMSELNEYAYILLVPILLSIICNMLFMIFILVVLFKKMRNQNNIEQHQGKKVAKAILILSPMMGLQCLLLCVRPDDRLWRQIHSYMSAVINSTQGFLVCLPFCFFNSDVHKAIKNRWQRLMLAHNHTRSTGQFVPRARRTPTQNHRKLNNLASTNGSSNNIIEASFIVDPSRDSKCDNDNNLSSSDLNNNNGKLGIPDK